MSTLLSVSVSDELKAELESSARARNTTSSELVREALRGYLWESRMDEIQAYGRGQAERQGIGPEDVERLVDDVRAEVAGGAERS